MEENEQKKKKIAEKGKEKKMDILQRMRKDFIILWKCDEALLFN